jgi:hypothetical protein
MCVSAPANPTLQGIVASGTNSARGSALIVFFILAATSLGTVVAAPLINQGLWALSAVTCGIHALSVGLLLLLPKMRSRIDEMGGGSGTLGPSRHDTNGATRSQSKSEPPDSTGYV